MHVVYVGMDQREKTNCELKSSKSPNLKSLLLKAIAYIYKQGKHNTMYLHFRHKWARPRQTNKI